MGLLRKLREGTRRHLLRRPTNQRHDPRRYLIVTVRLKWIGFWLNTKSTKEQLTTARLHRPNGLRASSSEAYAQNRCHRWGPVKAAGAWSRGTSLNKRKPALTMSSLLSAAASMLRRSCAKSNCPVSYGRERLDLLSCVKCVPFCHRIFVASVSFVQPI